MSATDFHGEQIITLAEQFKRYFAINELVHIAVDNFIYYSEGDITKCVAPDIHIVFGVAKYPLRRRQDAEAELEKLRTQLVNLQRQ